MISIRFQSYEEKKTIIKLKFLGRQGYAIVGFLAFAVVSAQTSFSGLEVGYHIRSLALAGGGSLLAGMVNDQLNPAVAGHSQRKACFGWLRYPAGIQGGIASLKYSAQRFNYTLSLRHLNYGSFDGYNEAAEPTGSYYSGDSWLTFSAAGQSGNRILAYGITTGIFVSQLEKYNAKVLTITPGVLFDLKQLDMKIGLSVQNWGLVLDSYTAASEELPTRIVAGFSRQLAHLPLELDFDLGYRFTDGMLLLGLSGVFALPFGLELIWGTSSAKIDQSSGNQDARDLFAASGIALSYTVKKYSLDIGGYFYGPGAWSNGIGLGVLF